MSPNGPSSFGFPVVDLPASATSCPEAAIKFLVGQLVESGRLPAQEADRVTGQILHRELQGSTAVGQGIALPHSKSDVVGEVLGIVGKSAAPVTWPDALDKEPVRVICLLVTPALDPAGSLRALETVARKIRGM